MQSLWGSLLPLMWVYCHVNFLTNKVVWKWSICFWMRHWLTQFETLQCSFVILGHKKASVSLWQFLSLLTATLDIEQNLKTKTNKNFHEVSEVWEFCYCNIALTTLARYLRTRSLQVGSAKTKYLNNYQWLNIWFVGMVWKPWLVLENMLRSGKIFHKPFSCEYLENRLHA